MTTFTSTDQELVRRWLNERLLELTTKKSPTTRYANDAELRYGEAITALNKGIRVTVTNGVVDPFED